MARAPGRSGSPGDSVCAVLRQDQPVGTAFLISDRQLATCAHVVEAALGGEAIKVGADVRLWFTQAPDAPMARGRVAAFSPATNAAGDPDPRCADIAILDLHDCPSPVPGAAVAELVQDTAIDGRRFQAHGYPLGSVTALPTAGMIEGIQNAAPFLLRNVDTAIPLQAGFSGAPVLDRDRRGVVGMLTQVVSDGQGRNIAGMAVSAQTILRLFPIAGAAVRKATAKRRVVDCAEQIKDRLLARLGTRLLQKELVPDQEDGVEYVGSQTYATAYFTAWNAEHPLNKSYPDDGDLFFCISLSLPQKGFDNAQLEIECALELSERGLDRTGKDQTRLISSAAKLAKQIGPWRLIADEGEWQGIQLRYATLSHDPSSDRVLDDLADAMAAMATVFSQLEL